MDAQKPVLVIFHGATGREPAERLVAQARVAVARRTATEALKAGFGGVLVATDAPELFGGLPAGVEIEADAKDSTFGFLARLQSIVETRGLAQPVVMGSGSLPLLGAAEFSDVAQRLSAMPEGCVTNNFFSSDLTGWTPGAAVTRLRDVPRDNVLPRRLRDQAGLRATTLARTTATTFDLDTPADLVVLALQESLDKTVREAMPEFPMPLDRYRAVMRAVCDPNAQVVVAGRVSSSAWQYLETETASRVRLLSEERGLATAAPGHRARSVLGFLWESVGAERFFEQLAELGDVAVLDTRVIEAHVGATPSREDRFESDLYRWRAIEDPFLREFTWAAGKSKQPVLLGGHSLVSGGLMALTDAAWRENDRRISNLLIPQD
ncbi:MAG: hypothetical protein KC495_02825 [Dehalococcoidia bacterium]|nr:hypothetical protein [Dehalococcoidia bacterium]